MSLFRRTKQQIQHGRDEPSLIDIDDSPTHEKKDTPVGKTFAAPKRNNFLNWTGSKKTDSGGKSENSSRVDLPQATSSGLASPLQSTLVSPRISTSSRASIFERSVDASVNVLQGSPNASAEHPSASLVDPSHSQLVIDNQIPSVLDASVEAITSNEDLDKVEIVTAQPMASTDNLSVPQLPNPWSEEENISTAHIPRELEGTAKRLSFVSYADLIGVEQAEAEAQSLCSHKSTSPRPLSPASTGLANTITPELANKTLPTSSDTLGRRQKSVVTLTAPMDLELTRTTMADTILAPTQMFENENPWAS